MKKYENKSKWQCPEFPWFGAKYPGAKCIDGYLWDLDSCGEDPNILTVGGDTPCPFCNTQKFIEEDALGVLDKFICDIVGNDNDSPTLEQEICANEKAAIFYLTEIVKLREKYQL